MVADGVQGHSDRTSGLSHGAQLRWLGVAAGALVGVAVLVWVGKGLLHKDEPAAAATPPGVVELTPSQMASVNIARAGASDGWLETQATGMIAADDTISTPVFLPFSGQVTQVFVQAGQAVTAGQPLMELRTGDVVDARNTLFTAEAQRASAAAALKLAQDNAARAEAIYKTAGGALKDYQQAQNDLVAAQAALRSAESAAAAARDKLAVFGKTGAEIGKLSGAHDISGLHPETAFHAPMAGLIAQRAVSPGEFVQSGGSTPLFVIANPARVWLVAQLGESEAGNVHVGDPVDVAVPALGGRVFHATIDNVATAIDPNTRRLTVRATIANTDRALKPQMFANFTIRHHESTGNAQPGISVPAMAVIHEGDTARVWVQTRPGVLQARKVQVGETEGDNVRILSGLSAGEAIATSGAIFVNEAGLGE